MGALCSSAAAAQTADDSIEKHLAASGGRAALAKLTSRTSVGAISLTTPAGELSGPIEVDLEAPNKNRTLVKLDLSAVGGGEVINDQRFDGTTGYVIEQTIDFSDFRDVDGVKVPFTTQATNPVQSVTARMTTVTHNTDIPDSYFVRPEASSAPAPARTHSLHSRDARRFVAAARSAYSAASWSGSNS